MTSIQEAFTTIALEKYIDAFESAGFTCFEDFFALSPVDLDSLLNEVGMLKGHTFKLKKLIEDGKAGIMPKPKPPIPAMSNSVLASPSAHSFTPAKPAMGPGAAMKAAQSQEVNNCKDLTDKANVVKSQLSNLIQSKESLMASLKQLAELDLEVYFQALAQMKTMQSSIRGLLQVDVEMNV